MSWLSEFKDVLTGRGNDSSGSAWDVYRSGNRGGAFSSPAWQRSMQNIFMMLDRKMQQDRKQKLLGEQREGQATAIRDLGAMGEYPTLAKSGPALKEAGFSMTDILNMIKRSEQDRLDKRLPLFEGKAQAQELMADRLVPGLDPTVPLPKAYQIEEKPIEIREMLKMAAERQKTKGLTQAAELKGREASDREKSLTETGKMLQGAFKGKFSAGLDPRIAALSAQETDKTGYKPFAQLKEKATRQVETARLTARAGYEEKAERPMAQIDWDTGSKALERRYQGQGLAGQMIWLKGGQQKHLLAQKKYAELRKLNVLNPLEAVNAAQDHADHVVSRYKQLIKEKPKEKEAIDREFRRKYGFLPR